MYFPLVDFVWRVDLSMLIDIVISWISSDDYLPHVIFLLTYLSTRSDEQ